TRLVGEHPERGTGLDGDAGNGAPDGRGDSGQSRTPWKRRPVALGWFQRVEGARFWLFVPLSSRLRESPAVPPERTETN
ncbi:hypothetical protein CRG98_049391, partial [Punica granatum]